MFNDLKKKFPLPKVYLGDLLMIVAKLTLFRVLLMKLSKEAEQAANASSVVTVSIWVLIIYML